MSNPTPDSYAQTLNLPVTDSVRNDQETLAPTAACAPSEALPTNPSNLALLSSDVAETQMPATRFAESEQLPRATPIPKAQGRPARSVGEYEVLKELGRGGM